MPTRSFEQGASTGIGARACRGVAFVHRFAMARENPIAMAPSLAWLLNGAPRASSRCCRFCDRSNRYRFTTVTPELTPSNALPETRCSQRVTYSLHRPSGEAFWNEPLAAEAAGPLKGCWHELCRRVRVLPGYDASSLRPFRHASDAVFFGPDSYRFVRAVLGVAQPARRAVDIGTGTGVGGIALSRHGLLTGPVVLTDVNARALDAARSNAELAGVAAEVISSDVLAGVAEDVDLIIATTHTCSIRWAGTIAMAVAATAKRSRSAS